MESIQCLPTRETPLPGESLASLLRRTAAAMGYDHVNLITRLLGHMTKPHQNLNHLPPGPPLDRLALLLRLSSKEVLQRTIHYFAHALVLLPAGTSPASFCDNKTALRCWEAQIAPACSACLAESPPHERLIWCFRPLQICTTHASPLLRRCPACRRPLSSSRKELVRCRCGNFLADGDLTKVSAETLAHSRTLELWLRPDVQVLPGLSSAASWWLAERMAVAISNTPNWVRGVSERLAIDPENARNLLCWTAVVEIFGAWPDRWFQFLDEYQTVAKIRNLSTGVGRSFGFLLRDVAHLESLGYPGPAEALRKYLLGQYHAGHVNQKLVLFQQRSVQQLVEQRPWYTQTEAAKVLQMRARRITALIRQGLLEGQLLPAGNRGRTVGLVSKGSVIGLQQLLTAGLGVREASRRLGIGKSRILELIRSRLLGPAVQTHHGWLICQKSVQATQTFYQGLPALDTDHDLWMSLREATQVYGSSGLKLVQAIDWAQTGQVAARADRTFQDLRGLWLFGPDLEKHLPPLRTAHLQQRGYSLSQLEKRLFPGHTCCESVLRKWIAGGLLHVQRQGHSWMVTHSEVERFRLAYSLGKDVRALLQISPWTLARWQALGRLTSVSGRQQPLRTRFALFRRADLVGLNRFRRSSSRSENA